MSDHGHNRVTKKKQGWNVKESKNRPETVTAADRVDLDPYRFSALIEAKGVAMKIFRTSYCPRVKSVDGAEHEIDCNLCNGSGFIDLDPLCTKGFIQSQDLEKLAHVEGFVDGNTVSITFPIGVELQYFTRIELEDFTQIYMQRIMRKPGSAVDVLKYKALRVNIIMDYDGVRYMQDADFKLDANCNIQWLGTQTQLIEFSSIPDDGAWDLFFHGELVGTYDSTTVAADIQTDMITKTGFADLTVTGDYDDGFLITYTGAVNGVYVVTTDVDGLKTGLLDVEIEVTQGNVGAKRPVDGKVYTIHYEAAIQYRAVSAMHVNRFTQYKNSGHIEHIKLPEQWMCAKEFLVKRKNQLGEELEQGPYSEHEITEED